MSNETGTGRPVEVSVTAVSAPAFAVAGSPPPPLPFRVPSQRANSLSFLTSALSPSTRTRIITALRAGSVK